MPGRGAAASREEGSAIGSTTITMALAPGVAEKALEGL
jgi:hypothetical protein